MARQLTRKQQEFVAAYVETGVGVKAALSAYTARAIAVEKMNLERVATEW